MARVLCAGPDFGAITKAMRTSGRQVHFEPDEDDVKLMLTHRCNCTAFEMAVANRPFDAQG